MNAEFFDAIEEIEKEKGIPRSFMYDKIRQAMLAAYRRDNPETDNVEIILDEDKKKIEMVVHKTVVDEVTDPNTEILPDAIAGVVDGARVTVVDPATNGVKSGPSTVKYVLIGALLGFFLMSGLLIVFDLADDKIHEERYLAENYSYPVLAVIPNIYIKYEGGSHYEKQ